MVKEYKFPGSSQPEEEPNKNTQEEQLELPLDQLAGAGDGFKNYVKMWHAVDIYIREIPQQWINQSVQEKWSEIKSEKLADDELRKIFLETSDEDWKKDSAYYYALILEATERKLFL